MFLSERERLINAGVGEEFVFCGSEVSYLYLYIYIYIYMLF